MIKLNARTPTKTLQYELHRDENQRSRTVSSSSLTHSKWCGVRADRTRKIPEWFSQTHLSQATRKWALQLHQQGTAPWLTSGSCHFVFPEQSMLATTQRKVSPLESISQLLTPLETSWGCRICAKGWVFGIRALEQRLIQWPWQIRWLFCLFDFNKELNHKSSLQIWLLYNISYCDITGICTWLLLGDAIWYN